MSRLRWFNELPTNEAETALLASCHSPRWARRVAAGRPYPDIATLQRAGAVVWRGLDPEEWRQALAAHPRIGEKGGASAELSVGEQSGMATANDEVRAAIAAGNLEYEARFGHVFLIRAAGRSPVEILTELRRRISHDPDTELRVAAAEHQEITELRLGQLLNPP